MKAWKLIALVSTWMVLLATPVFAQLTLNLYSVTGGGDVEDANLRLIDPASGRTTGVIPLSMANTTIQNGTGLATHPTTGDLYAIFKTAEDSGRVLATIDTVTGIAIRIGDTGIKLAAIAFDSDGSRLFGVTGDGGSPSHTLYILDQSDASPTLAADLAPGSDGEILAFNPNDGLLYRATGHDGLCDTTMDDFICFETIHPDTLVRTPIDISDQGTGLGELLNEEVQALTWWADQNVFLWKQDHRGPGDLFRVQTDGMSTLVGMVDHGAKGLAFALPEPGGQALAAIACLALLALRRRQIG